MLLDLEDLDSPPALTGPAPISREFAFLKGLDLITFEQLEQAAFATIILQEQFRSYRAYLDLDPFFYGFFYTVEAECKARLQYSITDYQPVVCGRCLSYHRHVIGGAVMPDCYRCFDTDSYDLSRFYHAPEGCFSGYINHRLIDFNRFSYWEAQMQSRILRARLIYNIFATNYPEI